MSPRPKPAFHPPAARQRGVMSVLVIGLMAVLLVGALALARVAETGALGASNAAQQAIALHASEIGLRHGLKEWDDANGQPTDPWFSNVRRSESQGIPNVPWERFAPVYTSPHHEVRIAMDRLCTTATVTDPLTQCVGRPMATLESRSVGADRLDVPVGVAHRITVRVSDQRGGVQFVQSMAYR